MFKGCSSMLPHRCTLDVTSGGVQYASPLLTFDVHTDESVFECHPPNRVYSLDLSRCSICYRCSLVVLYGRVERLSVWLNGVMPLVDPHYEKMSIGCVDMLSLYLLDVSTDVAILLSSSSTPLSRRPTPIYSPGSSSTPIYSPGTSTPPRYSPRASTPPRYSPGTSRNAECSNCKYLLDKITVLEATVDMHMHPEQHTVNSTVLFHEVYNNMGKLDLE
ncbi:hypothetical protein Tco_0780820 [Tanacetum coccineum]